MKKKKALILFSGGLDSRVTSKLIEELNFEVHLVFVRLPFGSGCGNFEGIEEFAEQNNFKLYIIDATKGKLLKSYLEIIRKPKHGRGKGINPCKDCKIFIFREGKKVNHKDSKTLSEKISFSLIILISLCLHAEVTRLI